MPILVVQGGMKFLETTHLATAYLLDSFRESNDSGHH